MAKQERPKGEELLGGPADDAAKRQAEIEEELKARVAELEKRAISIAGLPPGVTELHVVVQDSDVAAIAHGAAKVELTDQDDNRLVVGEWRSVPSPTHALAQRRLVLPIKASIDDEEIETLRRDAAVEARRTKFLADVIRSAQEAASPDAIRRVLDEGLRGMLRTGEGTVTLPIHGELGSLAGELAEERDAERIRASEYLESAQMLERQRDEVQTKREEVEADLREEQRVHRQDVDELKALKSQRERGLQRVRDLLDGFPPAGHRTSIEQRRQQYASLVQQIDDVVRPLTDKVDEPGWHTTGRAVDFPDSDDAIAAGRRIMADLGLEVPLKDEAAERVGLALAAPLRTDLYRGVRTKEGMAFELIDVPAMTQEARDELAVRIGIELDLVRQRELDRLRLQVAKDGERVAAAEERSAELQAYVDELLPQVRLLLEHLAGDEPAWWVVAGRVVGNLDELQGSILAVPRSRRGEADEPSSPTLRFDPRTGVDRDAD